MLKYLIFASFVLFVWSVIIEPNLLIVKKYKIKDINKYRIVFATDLHISKYDGYRLKRIVNVINKLNPDIVLFGGDFIKGYNDKITMPIAKQTKELAKIKARKIAVLGNHDGWYDKYTVKKALEKIGITVLNNQNTTFGNLYIAGTEDIKTGMPNVEAALENTEFPRILLTHSPDIYYDIKQNVNLILAGHVHGGQVRLPFIGALICPSKYGTKFSGGEYKETQNKMIVSKGLGTSILPIRLFNIPEIVLLTEN